MPNEPTDLLAMLPIWAQATIVGLTVLGSLGGVITLMTLLRKPATQIANQVSNVYAKRSKTAAKARANKLATRDVEMDRFVDNPHSFIVTTSELAYKFGVRLFMVFAFLLGLLLNILFQKTLWPPQIQFGNPLTWFELFVVVGFFVGSIVALGKGFQSWLRLLRLYSDYWLKKNDDSYFKDRAEPILKEAGYTDEECAAWSLNSCMFSYYKDKSLGVLDLD